MPTKVVRPESLLARWAALDQRARVAHEAVKAVAPALFRSVRAQLGLTQQQFAGRLGVNHTYISKIEHGILAPGQPILAELDRLLNLEMQAKLDLEFVEKDADEKSPGRSAGA